MIDEKRLAEIRVELGPRDPDSPRGAFPIEDAADDLLAMLDEERKRADEQYDRAENLEATVAGLRLAIVDGICDHDEDDETVRQAKRQHDDATQVEAMRSEVVYARAEAEAAEKRAEDAERKLAALHATRETWLTDPAAVQARALDALDAQRAHESGPAPPSFAEVVAAEARRVIDEVRVGTDARGRAPVTVTLKDCNDCGWRGHDELVSPEIGWWPTCGHPRAEPPEGHAFLPILRDDDDPTPPEACPLRERE